MKEKLKGSLKGQKTYIMAGLAVIAAVAGYLMGDLTLTEALNQAWAGGLAMTFRAAIAKTG